MRRETQNLMLLLVGGAVLKISITGAFSLYVKQGLRPWLIVAGALLVVLAAYGIARDVLAHKRSGQDEVDDDGHHHVGGTSVGWLLLAPVLAIFLVAPPALGAYAAERAATVQAPQPSASFPPLPAGDPVATALADYSSRAIWDDGATLKGRTVSLVGFVTPRAAGGFYLTRLVISCCAADAFPIKIFVAADSATPPADTWLTVTGTYGEPVRDETDQYDFATIAADSMTPTTQPAVPYEQ